MIWSMLAQEQTWFGNEPWKSYGIQVRTLSHTFIHMQVCTQQQHQYHEINIIDKPFSLEFLFLNLSLSRTINPYKTLSRCTAALFNYFDTSTLDLVRVFKCSPLLRCLKFNLRLINTVIVSIIPQLMPLTPISELRDSPGWVREMLPIFNDTCASNPSK
jgi:hypothetical protein